MQTPGLWVAKERAGWGDPGKEWGLDRRVGGRSGAMIQEKVEEERRITLKKESIKIRPWGTRKEPGPKDMTTQRGCGTDRNARAEMSLGLALKRLYKACWATAHGVAKDSDTTEQLNNNNNQ